MVLTVALPTAACSSLPSPWGGPASCTPAPAADLVPSDGVYLGVSLDPAQQTLADAADALGHAPAVSVAFTGLPPSAADERMLDDAVEEVRDVGGILLLTAEPHGGLAAVTAEVAAELAVRLDGYNRSGVPVVLRFAEEMNGYWYAWGQQPSAFVDAFRRVAAAVHQQAPGSAMMWAPAYGGGYPFAPVVDRGGAVTAADDPYAPYWPGDDAVDWVGLSLFHWGNAYPWGENEVPEAGKFVAQLTGEYVGPGGDERGVPDFYAEYGEQRGKPVAIAETGALHAPGAGGADQVAIAQAWAAQVFDPGLRDRLPRLAMVNWVEREARLAGTDTLVDWRVLSDPAVTAVFREALPAWARWAGDVPPCTR